MFDVTENGGILFIFFNDPIQNEIEQISHGSFEIGFVKIENVIMMVYKWGDLDWMDAPYTPHLSRYLERYPILDDSIGLALTTILIDTKNRKVKALRVSSLGDDFSRKFIGEAMEEKIKPFNVNLYDNNLQKIYTQYTTDDIVQKSDTFYKIK